MRSQPLVRGSSTQRRDSISESHPALNSLLRRLSNRTKFSSFGRVRGQAKVRKTIVHICIKNNVYSPVVQLLKMQGASQGQNSMPRHTSGVRSGSSKRSTSDQTREQELRPANGLDVNHSDSEEPQNHAAILASCNGPLQRLANIARYFELSFSQDIAIVEGYFGPEMDRENEIQRLTGVVQTLTHARNEQLEDLQHEIEQLKASEEDCIRKKEGYQAMQTELEEQHTRKEEEREKDYKQKLQKSLKAKIAENEAGSKEKTQELEDKAARLSAKNEKLEQSLTAAEEKLKNKKVKHDRLEKSLEGENEQLQVELRQVKSEFPVERQSVQY